MQIDSILKFCKDNILSRLRYKKKLPPHWQYTHPETMKKGNKVHTRYTVSK